MGKTPRQILSYCFWSQERSLSGNITWLLLWGLLIPALVLAGISLRDYYTEVEDYSGRVKISSSVPLADPSIYLNGDYIQKVKKELLQSNNTRVKFDDIVPENRVWLESLKIALQQVLPKNLVEELTSRSLGIEIIEDGDEVSTEVQAYWRL